LYVAKLNNLNPCENTHNDNHQNGVTSYSARTYTQYTVRTKEARAERQ